MDRLAQEIERYIVNHLKQTIFNLGGHGAELRTVFHGPPIELLDRVFERLTRIDGGIEVRLADGPAVILPVLLQVSRLSEGEENPAIGASGRCDANHLLALRNSPSSPRFVALVPPGHQSSLSFSSASDDFGLSTQTNAGTATISQWWQDPFIQHLVESALARFGKITQEQKQEANKLIRHAIHAADEADRHIVTRPNSWRLLSRLWSIADQKLPFGFQLSLVTGYPPLEDGTVLESEQVDLLKELTERLSSGFKQAIDQFKERAGDEKEAIQSLDAALSHLQQTCDVPTALGQSAPFYYGPLRGDEFADAPSWWIYLTVEKWRSLLDEEVILTASLRLECTNKIVPSIRGLPDVVASTVKMRITAPAGATTPFSAQVTRNVAGEVSDLGSFDLPAEDTLVDPFLPKHRSPARYSVEASNLKKGALRVVSLSSWAPGVIVYSRTASKATLPKRVKSNKDGATYETSLVLSGQGRHYIDVFVRSDVTPSESALGIDESGSTDVETSSPIAMISDSAYGFEVDASTECTYEFSIGQVEDGKSEKIRVSITCDETAPEECGSEFERLIVPRQHKLDSLRRLRKRGFLAHL